MQRKLIIPPPSQIMFPNAGPREISRVTSRQLARSRKLITEGQIYPAVIKGPGGGTPASRTVIGPRR